MAAKKKPAPQSSTAAEKRTQSKKSAAKPVFTSSPKNYKATAAFTSKGQKASGLAPRKQGSSLRATPKTKAKNAESGLAGSGTPLGASFAMSRPTAARNVVNAALTATLLPGKGKIAGAIGRRVGSIADNAAWNAASKGLEAAGRGGKVSKTMTPFGPTLRSTRIGSVAQQAARMENLTRNADRIATATGRQTSAAVARTITRTGRAAKNIALTVAVAKNTKPKRNKKK